MKRRRGSTLIELIMSLGAGSMVMLLAIKVVHQSFVASSINKENTEYGQTLNRLARQYRSDMRSSLQVSWSDEKHLTLEMPEETLHTYRFEEGYIQRETTKAGVILQNERFRLSENSIAHMQCDNQGQSCSLFVAKRIGDEKEAKRIELHVVAKPGRWTNKPSIAPTEEPKDGL
jgi:type II secretory pathway component PulJ